MPVRNILVCIVDDDASVRTSLSSLMRSAGIRALVFDTAESFLVSSSLTKADCIITDIHMPGMNGIALKSALDARNVLVPVIMITARADKNTRAQALAAGAFHLFNKPFQACALMEQLEKALERGPA